MHTKTKVLASVLMFAALPAMAETDEPLPAPQRPPAQQQTAREEAAADQPLRHEFQFAEIDPLKELLKKGIKAHNQGDDNEAEQIFRSVLARDPDNVHALFNLGSIYQQRGSLVEASDNFQQVLRIAPNDSGARQALAAIQAQSPQSDRANAAQVEPFSHVGSAQAQTDDSNQLKGRAKQDSFSNEIEQAQAQSADLIEPKRSGLHLRMPSLGLPSTKLLGSATSAGLKAMTGVVTVGGGVALLGVPLLMKGRTNNKVNNSGLPILPILSSGLTKPSSSLPGVAHNFGGIPHNFGGGGVKMPHNFGGGGVKMPHNFGGGGVKLPHSFGGGGVKLPHSFGGGGGVKMPHSFGPMPRFH